MAYKILMCIGSRANYGRLQMVAQEIRSHPEFELGIVTFAEAANAKLEIEPKFRIESLMFADSHEAMALTTGVTLMKITDVLKGFKPDLVFLHADRHEVLACAIAASYMNIPIAHTEGGENTGTIDQKVRYAISSLADIHFPVTASAFDRLRLMGCHHVCVVGSTGVDLARKVTENLHYCPHEFEPYVLLVHHPNTTHPEEIEPLLEALDEVPIKKIWVASNVDAGARTLVERLHNKDYEFRSHVSPEDFTRLMFYSSCMVGNTSSGIKEGAFLGVPYVCVGDRQNGREHADNVKFVGYNKQTILEQTLLAIKKGRHKPDYKFGDGHAAEKIVVYIMRMLEGK